MKQGFKDRDNRRRTPPEPPVFDGWNAEGAKLRFIFGNEGAPQTGEAETYPVQLP